MKKITGHLTFECEQPRDALVIVAGEIAGRWRELGWDVDGVEVVVRSPEPES